VNPRHAGETNLIVMKKQGTLSLNRYYDIIAAQVKYSPSYSDFPEFPFLIDDVQTQLLQ